MVLAPRNEDLVTQELAYERASLRSSSWAKLETTQMSCHRVRDPTHRSTRTTEDHWGTGKEGSFPGQSPGNYAGGRTSSQRLLTPWFHLCHILGIMELRNCGREQLSCCPVLGTGERTMWLSGVTGWGPWWPHSMVLWLWWCLCKATQHGVVKLHGDTTNKCVSNGELRISLWMVPQQCGGHSTVA